MERRYKRVKGLTIYMKMMTERYLNKNYEFKKNEVIGRLFIKKVGIKENFELLDETKFNSIARRLDKKGIRISNQKLKTILNSDFVENFNPFKDYFLKLEAWDKKIDYIEELASTISTTNDDYFKWLFRKWIVAMVACSIREGVTNQTVLILCGRQNLGKTTWFKSLIPNELKDYMYEGSITPGDKDATLLLSDKLIINMDELASFNKYKVDQFKELITKEVITERRAYGMFNENYPRRASFVGSSNQIEILTDITGNRRYLCNEVLKIDFSHGLNLNKVYSQAIYLLNDPDFRYYFNDEDVKIVEENNKNFLQTSEEMDWIEELFDLPKVATDIIYMNATEIIEFIKLKKNITKIISADTIGKLMSAKGFRKKTRDNLKKYELILK